MINNEHRQLKWCNVGDRTVESTCIPDRMDVAILFEIRHNEPRYIWITAFQWLADLKQNKKIYTNFGRGCLTFSKAKAYPNEHMNEIMDEVRSYIL